MSIIFINAVKRVSTTLEFTVYTLRQKKIINHLHELKYINYYFLINYSQGFSMRKKPIAINISTRARESPPFSAFAVN